jgi:LacI family transcriptional regulator
LTDSILDSSIFPVKKKTSIYDIAKHLKVSAATVSFVLNGKADEHRISEELKRKILDNVKSVDYQPNLVAKSLRTGKSRLLGMLVEDISDIFFSSISRMIERQVNKHDYRILFASTENDLDKARALIKVFRERQVEGYIIAPPPGTEQEIKALMEDGFPVILFDRYFPELSTNKVIIENFDGAYQGTRHLQENDLKNIGFVTLESNQTQMHDRLLGYSKAIQEMQQQEMVLKLPYDICPEEAVEKIIQFISDHAQLDALFFATNYLVISGLTAIIGLGKTIPEDLAVVGFDDHTHFHLFSPSITAIAQPIQEISEEVVRQLIAALSNKEERKKQRAVILPVQLIVRNSSKVKKRSAKLNQSS